MTDARELLQSYARDGSESAFRELVRRHLDLVHSVAFRRVGGDAHLARDVAQQVFTDLARKARAGDGDFGAGPVHLGGWLHGHTCLVSSTLVRSEQRRRRRESQAAEMNLLNQAGEAHWRDLAPELDAAVNELTVPTVPPTGHLDLGESEHTQAAGLKRGDIIVGLDGKQVEDMDRYFYLRLNLTSAAMRLTVWNGEGHVEIEAAPPDHRFGAPFDTYKAQR